MIFSQGGGGSDNLLNAITAFFEFILLNNQKTGLLACIVGAGTTRTRQDALAVRLASNDDETITNRRVRNTQAFPQKKKAAFTLAEVLITLGIIGVVAAMTLPTLVGNYKKKATVTKVKKFYTVMSQATNLAIAEYGSMDGWDGFSTHNNGPELKHWFDKYLKPHLKVIDEYIDTDEESGNQTFFVIFADGSVMLLTNYAASVSAPNEDTGIDDNHVVDNYNGLIHVYYLTDEKALKRENRQSCVNSFAFLFYSPLKKQYFFQPYAYQANTPEKYNREFFKSQVARGNNQYCAALMMSDGWEIKDDYPFNYKY